MVGFESVRALCSAMHATSVLAILESTIVTEIDGGIISYFLNAFGFFVVAYIEFCDLIT